MLAAQAGQHHVQASLADCIVEALKPGQILSQAPIFIGLHHSDPEGGTGLDPSAYPWLRGNTTRRPVNPGIGRR
jgi:hypothetical protein